MLQDQQCAKTDNPSTAPMQYLIWWRIRGFSVERFLYHWLSEKWCGNDMVPLDHRTFRWSDHGCDYVFSFLGDAGEVGFGFPSEWHGIYRRKDFHRVIRWYIRQWMWSEWFGLRRWLWFKLLFRRVARHRKLRPLP